MKKLIIVSVAVTVTLFLCFVGAVVSAQYISKAKPSTAQSEQAAAVPKTNPSSQALTAVTRDKLMEIIFRRDAFMDGVLEAIEDFRGIRSDEALKEAVNKAKYEVYPALYLRFSDELHECCNESQARGILNGTIEASQKEEIEQKITRRLQVMCKEVLAEL